MITRGMLAVGAVVFLAVGVHALTLTPVWEIARPAEWAPIQEFGIHYDGVGNPLVVCLTDSGVFTVDHTGAQTTIWTFVPGDSALVQRAVLSPSGKYVAIVTNRLEDEEAWTWVGDIRVMDAQGTLVWEVTGTPYREIALADAGPWSVSTKPEYGEFDYVYHDYLVRDPSGAVADEGTCPSCYSIAVSEDGTRFAYSTMDSIYTLDRAGAVVGIEPIRLPGLEDYELELEASTPSHGISVSYLLSHLPTAGKIVFGDSTGAYGTPIDVAASWHGDLDISDDGEHAVLGARGRLCYLSRESASIDWDLTDPDGFDARSYRSVQISEDGSLVVAGVSRADSTTARLEMYDAGGNPLFEEQYPTTGAVFVRMLKDGVFIAVQRVQLTILGRDLTLSLCAVSL
ncbi:MAG: hypothetical protein MUE60_16615 [Candidatus Eisenbacteria bacterium]|nr:hypothetical protein [Candidatus Eisenbacteria bacterium]